MSKIWRVAVAIVLLKPSETKDSLEKIYDDKESRATERKNNENRDNVDAAGFQNIF